MAEMKEASDLNLNLTVNPGGYDGISISIQQIPAEPCASPKTR